MMFRYYKFLLFFFSVIASFSGNFTSCKDIVLNLTATSDESFPGLSELFKNKVFIEKISFKADFLINQKELKYLINLPENCFVNLGDIKKVLLNLKRKNKFESVNLKLEPSNANDSGNKSYDLVFDLKGLWTFSKIKIKSSLLGKARYQQFYIIEPGEPFELSKHEHAISNIKKELSSQGYLNTNIKDIVNYDDKRKTVSVTLEIDNTDVYVVRDVIVKFDTQDNINNKNINLDNYKILQDKIYKMFKKSIVNSYFSKSEISDQIKEVKAFLGQKGYLNPKIKFTLDIDKENKKVVITCLINIKEKKEFEFFGNHFFSSKELINEFLVDNTILLMPSSMIAQDIEALYKKKGFWHAKVDWKEEPEKYFFIIKEGPRIKISKVKIENSDTIKEEDFDELIKLDYYDEEILIKKIEELTAKFLKEGYWDFAIEKQDFIPLNKEKSVYELILKVNMGKQKFLTGLSISGGFVDEFKDLPVLPYISANPEPFDYNLVHEQKKKLLKYFQDQGYLFTQIKPEFKENEQGTELVWDIKLNSNQIKFGQTIITGNTRVKPSVVLNQIQYNQGDIWDKSKIDSSVKRLRSLNIFESVSLLPYDFSGTEESKVMILKLSDDDPYEARFRIGFQQFNRSFAHIPSTSYRIGGSFLWKNPSGRADQFRLDGDLTRFTGNFALSYQVPNMGSLPVNTLTKFYSDHYSQPVSALSNHKFYTERHQGFVATFKNYDETYQANLTTGFEFMKLSGISKKLVEVIDFEPDLVDRAIPYYYIEPTFIIDKFDNKLDPVKGFFTLFSAKGKFPLNIKNGYFVKLLFEQSAIWPIYRSLIGALRLRVGHIFNPNFNKIMPTDRFYLGGSTSLRGYEPDLAPPLNSFRCGDTVSWVPVGGKTMLNLNAELRFPIYKNFSGVLFNDIGLLAQEKLSEINANKLLGDTGFGLRYLTPIGPIRFDIGFKWKKRTEDDKRYAWFLTLGQAF